MIAAALCAAGAEKALSNELKKLSLLCNVKLLESGFARVRFEADLEGLYYSLLSLRTADRIFLEAAVFPARDFDELFEGAASVHWDNYIPRGMGLVVDKVRTKTSVLSAETSIQAIVHKACAQKLCGIYKVQRLPEGGKTAVIRVYIERNNARLMLDITGDPLFKRGYRLEGGAAPLRETTAAAMLLLSCWKRKFPLCDPFCGSGTIAIEAALYALDAAAGLGRSFAISDLSIADSKIENKTRALLREKVDFSRTIRIYASDSDNMMIEAAKANLKRALGALLGESEGAGSSAAAIETLLKSPNIPKFRKIDFKNARALDDTGYIISNPPYGKRIGNTESAEKTYSEMPVLLNAFPAWNMAIISDHPGFESFFGKKAAICREITNGALKTFVYEFAAEKNVKTELKKADNEKKILEKNKTKDYNWTW
ncbi:RNA methyltransferase [Spirochaetia bacterium]|nr:RNA methyltransferase [Spirochaetia bacterium]